jgi:hypothetical protein
VSPTAVPFWMLEEKEVHQHLIPPSHLKLQCVQSVLKTNHKLKKKIDDKNNE